MIGTFLPRDGKLLILVNGAYGRRMAKICDYLGRAYATSETPEDTPPNLGEIESILGADSAITHVAAVHCVTTSGIVNPVGDIAAKSNEHTSELQSLMRN